MANIVYYELDNSPFSLRLNDFMFYFSSDFYKNKFIDSYKEYIRQETLKLSVKYHNIIYADDMLLLNLYKSIEKRGFKVLYQGKVLEKDYYIDCKLNIDYSSVMKEE